MIWPTGPVGREATQNGRIMEAADHRSLDEIACAVVRELSVLKDRVVDKVLPQTESPPRSPPPLTCSRIATSRGAIPSRDNT